ncbi:hypothetical protein PTI98_011734 [Pleurotus ostreatus]|nr:hypothetical protein PTI98_011734 [Pleurotus ostreatus]
MRAPICSSSLFVVKMTIPSVTLNNGVQMPAIGFGTWAGMDPAEWHKSEPWLATALKAGYTHFDTAQMYGTEKYIGNILKDAGIPRDKLFITSKLLWNYHSLIEESLDTTLKDLGTDYVDLFLIHWPQMVFYEEGNIRPRNPDGTLKVVESPSFNDVWAVFEKLLDTGKVKSIGVSNFSIKTLEELLKTAKVVPSVNQIELHPYLAQTELVEYCKSKGIVVTAYAPTGYSQVLGDPLIIELAAKYKASPAQVVLAWHLARGTTAVPKSTSEAHQKENLNLPTLDSKDVERITALDKGLRICNKPTETGIICGWSVERMGW